MINKIQSLTHNKSLGLLILRVVVGVIFIMAGYMKFVHMNEAQGTIAFFAAVAGLPAFAAYLVATVEILGGVSLIVGYGSKIAAALLSIVMIVAIITVHTKVGGYEYPVR